MIVMIEYLNEDGKLTQVAKNVDVDTVSDILQLMEDREVEVGE